MCAAHQEEATAVHIAIERLARKELSTLDPDAMLGPLLGFEDRADSLDVVEWVMAVEEEFGHGRVPEAGDASVASWQEAVKSALLGPAAHHCAWEPSTIWVRSARGIVNERVRCRGGCSCGDREAPGTQ
jgi:acyl carrier protein